MYTEIVKIIEGGIIGDKEKVYNYSKLLVDNLNKNGDKSLARKIDNTLNNKKSKLASLDDFATKPVDQESRLDMVNISYPTGENNLIVLNKYINKEIKDFIGAYSKQDELLKAGLEYNNSLLLYGPPGCGKTSLAKYISEKTELPLVTARLDGLVSSLLGSTAKNIRKIFDYASKRECILFLDEFDVLAKLRDDKQELGELKRVVNSLIQNIDEFSGNSILIAATNHHELLDPAIWRRFSKVITLNKPEKEEISILVEELSQKMPTNYSDNNKKNEQIINALVGLSYADVKTIFSNSIRKAIINDRTLLNHWDIIQEIYLFKNHTLTNEDDFIRFMNTHGVTHRELNENYDISLRKIREATKNA